MKKNLIVVSTIHGGVSDGVKCIFPEKEYTTHTLGGTFSTLPCLNEYIHANAFAQKRQELKKQNPQGKIFIYAVGDAVSGMLHCVANDPEGIAGIVIEGMTLTDSYYTFDDIKKLSKKGIRIAIVHNSAPTDVIRHKEAEALFFYLCQNKVMSEFHSVVVTNQNTPLLDRYTSAYAMKLSDSSQIQEHSKIIRNIKLFLEGPTTDEQGRDPAVGYTFLSSESFLLSEVSQEKRVFLASLIGGENKRFYSRWFLMIGISLSTLMLLSKFFSR